SHSINIYKSNGLIYTESGGVIMKIVTSEEMKKIDQYAIGKIGIDGRILMENAGRVAAKNIMKRFHNQTFCVLIGSGNNGGDGFVIAKVLKENRHEVDVC